MKSISIIENDKYITLDRFIDKLVEITAVPKNTIITKINNYKKNNYYLSNSTLLLNRLFPNLAVDLTNFILNINVIKLEDGEILRPNIRNNVIEIYNPVHHPPEYETIKEREERYATLMPIQQQLEVDLEPDIDLKSDIDYSKITISDPVQNNTKLYNKYLKYKAKYLELKKLAGK